MEKKIEEILGYTTSRGQATETIARRYYVIDESPEMAKNAFEAYADSLPVRNFKKFVAGISQPAYLPIWNLSVFTDL